MRSIVFFFSCHALHRTNILLGYILFSSPENVRIDEINKQTAISHCGGKKKFRGSFTHFAIDKLFNGIQTKIKLLVDRIDANLEMSLDTRIAIRNKNVTCGTAEEIQFIIFFLKQYSEECVRGRWELK